MRVLSIVALAVLLGLPSLVACKGGVVDPGTGDGRPPVRRDGEPPIPPPNEAGTPPPVDSGGSYVDLPTRPHDPCPLGKCGPNLLCLAGICHQTCSTPNAKCNEKVAPCEDDEACQPASSFADACYRATSRWGEPCGQANSVCAGGSLCVKASGAIKCMRLCKYGCNGRPCMPLRNGCQVCAE
ncbi:MAG: hypothetical protein IT371_26375 [Deltaproteobacteria bacterium]|nr:hypothetical protein [Deltaproteobacteria bacterium]